MLFGILSLLQLSATDGSTPAAPGRKPFADATARRHEARERDFDLRHIRLEIALDIEAKRLSGRTTQTFAAIRPGATALELDCAELDVQAVSDGQGAALGFSHRGDKLRIDLGAAHPEGVPFDIRIDYSGSPRTGMHFIHPDAGYPKKALQAWTQGEMEDTRYWVPIPDAPADRATSEMIATVPEGFTAISNGRLVGTSADPAKHTRTFHWKEEVSHPTYLLTLAVGEMDEVEDKSPSGVPLLYLVPKGRKAEIARSFGKTGAMVEFFSQWIGVPYPWEKYAQVVVLDFTFGGMENASATTLTDRTLHDERAHLDYRSEPLVAHELAHQWWGDLLTCKSWEHIWLNEGFATYFEALWQEHDEGADEFAYNMLEKADHYFKEDEEKYRRPIVQRLYTDPGELFDRHSYEKGSLVLHTLRHELGDAAFQKGIGAYARLHRERAVETDELRMAVEGATGRTLGWFFDQWLFHPGHPELAVEQSYDTQHHLLTLRIRQTQETADGTSLFRLPMVVRLFGESDFRDVPVILEGKEQTLLLPADSEPRAVVLDPGNRALKQVKFERTAEALAVVIQRSTAAVDRILAARELGQLASPRAITILSQMAANDPFWGARAEATKALGRTRAAAAFDAIAAAAADKESRVRRAAAAALGELKDARGADLLARMLDHDEGYYARAEAAKALGVLGGPKALGLLKAALDQESHQDIIRVKTFDGLGELRDKAAIPVAREWSAYGRPPKAREAAIQALGKLGKDDRAVREHIESILLKDVYIFARRSAIDALGELRDPDALPALDRASRVEIDSRVRRAARDAMSKIREKAGEDGLRRELEALRAEGSKLERRLSTIESRTEERK